MDDKIIKEPELRFAEFKDDWEQRKLGKILVEFTNKSTKENEYTVISSTNTGMEVRDGRVSGASNIGYKIIEDGDLVLSPQNLWLGNININDIGVGLVSPSYKTFKFKGIKGQFIKPILRTSKLLEEYKNASTQGASVVRRNLELESFYQIMIYVPNSIEQTKIGNYFSNLDNLISLHQRELELLKQNKKRMLKKMFPQNGSNFPEIRFFGFDDAWEQRKLGDIGSVSMCKRVFKNQTSDNGDVPFYKIGTFGSDADAYISRELFEEYKSKFSYPEKGDILISASGSIGRTVEFSGKDEYFQDSNIIWLKHNNEIINPFLKQLYTVIKWSGIEGTTIKRLYNENVLKTEIMVPSVEEQKRISSYFDNLDNLITLHQRELDSIKKIKKSMLQKMYI